MLKRLILRNFQIHKTLTVEFDREVTVIVGSNNAGKTAVIRALYWLCTNRGRVSQFKRHGAKYVSVQLDVDNHTIIRKQGKENVYIVDGQKLKAFGAGVPEAVTNILKMNDLNFQKQREDAFWFALSAGNVAKELNKIVNLEAIDKASKYITSELRDAKARVKVTKERLTAAKEARRSLRYVSEMNEDLKRVEAKHARYQAQREYVTSARQAIEDTIILQRRLNNAADARTSGETLMTLIARVEELENRRNALRSLIQESEGLTKRRIEIRSKRKRLEKKLTLILKNGGCPLCGQPMKSGKTFQDVQATK